jgi:hypothetical protein
VRFSELEHQRTDFWRGIAHDLCERLGIGKTMTYDSGRDIHTSLEVLLVGALKEAMEEARERAKDAGASTCPLEPVEVSRRCAPSMRPLDRYNQRGPRSFHCQAAM